MSKDSWTSFEDHPDPMWVHDPETQRIVDVNAAAVAAYGYSRDEFLAMTTAELLPLVPEQTEQASLRTDDGQRNGLLCDHRLKNGAVIAVTVKTRAVDGPKGKATLVIAHDVSHLIPQDPSSAALEMQNVRAIVDSLPGNFVVVRVHRFVMVAASDAYLATAHKLRSEVIGKPLFDVFPDAPCDDSVEGAGHLTRSFYRVIENGIPDVMPLVDYAVQIPGAESGAFETRHFSVVNAPILGRDGKTAFIIHRVEEVTDQIRLARSLGLAPDVLAHSQNPMSRLAHELMRRSEELQEANNRRQAKAAKLRTVQHLLKIGFWQRNFTTDHVNWSDEVYEMLGLNRIDGSLTRNAYVERIHPDDREAARQSLNFALESDATDFETTHRYMRPDGKVIHVRVLCEIAVTPYGTMMSGVIQDITAQMQVATNLREAAAMTVLAGRVAKVGGWRLELNPFRIHWSDEVAAIHDEPPGTIPDIDTAMEYYVPGHREAIRVAVAACLRQAQPFDEVLQIETARHRRIWVRAIGEPELDAGGRVTAVRGAFQDISDIVAARDAAAVMAARLAEILESMNDGFILLDTEWRYAFVNGQAERILMRSRDSLIGKVLWDEFPALLESPDHAIYLHAVESGKSVRFENFYPEPLNIWFDVSVHPTPEGLAIYFRDVTAEHARSEQLRLLELSISHLNDMVIITDAHPLDEPDGPRIVYVNEAVIRQTGFSRTELIGATPRILQGEATDRSELARIRAALHSAEPVHAELVNYDKQGRRYWIDISINPVADKDGNLTHMVAVQRDITARKQAEQKLRLSEERFRLVSNTSDAVIWDWDLGSGTAWYNDNMLTLFGHPAGDAIPDDDVWRSRIHPDDFERVRQTMLDALNGDAKEWQDKYRYFKGDGTVVVLLNHGFLIRDAEGKALRFVGSFIDITAQDEKEAQRRQSQKLEAMGQLTGGVAHDFNNLLTIILGTAERIAATATDPELRHYAELALAAADRGAALTNRLLAFARKQPLCPQSVDVNALVSSVESMLRRTLPENVELALSLADGLWPVELDSNQLEVALLNLALNARDAMPEGGKLLIETANVHLDATFSAQIADVLPGPCVRVEVIDNGTGMPRDVVARAFEPFFTTKQEGAGSGLGLSMVYGFVKQSGGHVLIDSEPGKGTAFRLYFPRSLSDRKHSEVATPAAPVRGGPERILVVEDDEHVREYLVGQLRALGYQVVHAPNAGRGLEVLASTPGFDMLLTDVIMPNGMDGWRLSEMARERIPDLKVLFTSGYSENALSRDGKLNPGVELLSKPYRRHELAAKVRKVLDS